MASEEKHWEKRKEGKLWLGHKNKKKNKNLEGEQHQIQDGGQQEADEGAWRDPQMWNEKLP